MATRTAKKTKQVVFFSCASCVCATHRQWRFDCWPRKQLVFSVFATLVAWWKEATTAFGGNDDGQEDGSSFFLVALVCVTLRFFLFATEYSCLDALDNPTRRKHHRPRVDVLSNSTEGIRTVHPQELQAPEAAQASTHTKIIISTVCKTVLLKQNRAKQLLASALWPLKPMAHCFVSTFHSFT